MSCHMCDIIGLVLLLVLGLGLVSGVDLGWGRGSEPIRSKVKCEGAKILNTFIFK